MHSSIGYFSKSLIFSDVVSKLWANEQLKISDVTEVSSFENFQSQINCNSAISNVGVPVTPNGHLKG